jgi:hypothetical protein
MQRSDGIGPGIYVSPQPMFLELLTDRVNNPRSWRLYCITATDVHQRRPSGFSWTTNTLNCRCYICRPRKTFVSTFSQLVLTTDAVCICFAWEATSVIDTFICPLYSPSQNGPQSEQWYNTKGPSYNRKPIIKKIIRLQLIVQIEMTHVTALLRTPRPRLSRNCKLTLEYAASVIISNGYACRLTVYDTKNLMITVREIMVVYPSFNTVTRATVP